MIWVPTHVKIWVYLNMILQDSGKIGEEQLQLIHYTKQLVTETNAQVKQLNNLASNASSESENKQRRMQKERLDCKMIGWSVGLSIGPLLIVWSMLLMAIGAL